ncbi:recombinase RecA [Candidatus Dojkabacteria bacterium]|uniref:Protein RecA n=1 Tax=Candidatus Dojkabacteria bacterium TaxID=2099670 RepID=A0A3M0YZZ5_9BACT|nr:MAG: recombinase RecA [Candidatus Dojkabacteria bacterium]
MSKEENKESNLKQRQDALKMAMSQITKQFGEGSIMTLADDRVKKMDVIPTGAVSLDIALGVGGIPKGRIVEIFGPESSGKTTLAMSIIAECQKIGGIAAFIDAEHAFDSEYAKKIGINTSELLVSQPDYGEQALEILETLLRSGAVDVAVVDSVAALTPKAEIDGEMGDQHMGLQARLMSQALRKITGIASKTNSTVIFINQLRQKIGIVFGNPETTTGGNALKFYASVRLDIRSKEKITRGEDVVGHVVRVKVVKNKVAPPFKESEFEIIHGLGIDKVSSLLDAALKFNVIEKAGAWFRINGENLGQGRDTVKELISNDSKLMLQIWQEVKKQAGL